MKILLITSAIILSSCAVFKQKNKEVEHRTEHHYHDSTHTIERETITERLIPGDSTKAYFELEKLLKEGSLKSVDRHFTTEIRYKDNGLMVTTYMDSLMERIRALERITEKKASTAEITIDAEKKSSNKEVKNRGITYIIIAVILILLFFWFRIEFSLFKVTKTPKTSE